jgi:hypothetical protein
MRHAPLFYVRPVHITSAVIPASPPKDLQLNRSRDRLRSSGSFLRKGVHYPLKWGLRTMKGACGPPDNPGRAGIKAQRVL